QLGKVCEPLSAQRIGFNLWIPDIVAAFDTTYEPSFLSFPDFSNEVCVAVDASNTGIVLYQLADDVPTNRKWITFVAHALHAPERKYAATKRELLSHRSSSPLRSSTSISGATAFTFSLTIVR
ncbi:hypothetical protein BVRB_027560, partial [Beta vulgaris subsp. vulgaris]